MATAASWRLAAGGVLTVAGQGRVQSQEAEASVADGGEVGDDEPQLVQHVVGVQQRLVGRARERHDDRHPTGQVPSGCERPSERVGPMTDGRDLHEVVVAGLVDHRLLDHAQPLLQPVDVRTVRVVQGRDEVVEEAERITPEELAQ